MVELKDLSVSLIISKELQQQILYTHSIVGKKEFCAILLIKELSGSIQDKNLSLIAQKMYPINIGTETYVGGDITDEYARLMDFYSDSMDYKWAYMHTHHTMGSTPSGTDMNEVRDQASNYEYFLSLIVNFEGKYSAKLSFLGKMDSEVFYQTKFGKYPYNISKEAVFYTDVDIELECEDNFKVLLTELKAKEKPVFDYRNGTIGHNLGGVPNVIPNYGKSPYKGVYEEKYGNFAEYIGKTQQKELFSGELSTNTKITGEYLVREILTSKDINLLNLRTNSTFSLVQAYTMIPEHQDEFEEILDSISLCNTDIVSSALKITNRYVDYEKNMIEAYKKVIDYLLTFSKIDTNGFISRFIIIILEELNTLYDTEEEFDIYLKERGLIDYYGE